MGLENCRAPEIVPYPDFRIGGPGLFQVSVHICTCWCHLSVFHKLRSAPHQLERHYAPVKIVCAEIAAVGCGATEVDATYGRKNLVPPVRGYVLGALVENRGGEFSLCGGFELQAVFHSGQETVTESFDAQRQAETVCFSGELVGETVAFPIAYVIHFHHNPVSPSFPECPHQLFEVVALCPVQLEG